MPIGNGASNLRSACELRTESKPAPTLRSPVVLLFRGVYCGYCSPRFECFPPLSDLHNPIKLIKNQNASTIKADKLKAKMSETIISSAPAAFSSEYLGDELGSFSSCRSRYATMINTTPMNPARSNKWKLMVIAPRLRGGLNLAFLKLITTTAVIGSGACGLYSLKC
jgi:hypothetical protein